MLFKNILIASLFILFEGIPSGVSAQEALDSIPFELGSDSRIYIRCRVNDSDTLRFLFDSGATDMVVNTQSEKAVRHLNFNEKGFNYGASGGNAVPVSTGNSFCAGGTRTDDLKFIGVPYPPEFWDGVVGLSFMKNFTVRLDYDRRMIYLYRPGTYKPDRRAVCLQIDYEMGVPVVPVKVCVNGTYYDLRLEIDLGSDRILDLNTPFVKKQKLLGSQKPFAISRISSSDTNTGELQNVYFDEIVMGSLRLPRIPGAFSTVTEGVQASNKMDGVMGNNLLQRFHLTFDFANDDLYLEPNNLLYKPFYSFLIF